MQRKKEEEYAMRKGIAIILFALMAVGLVWFGCSKENNTVTAPVTQSQQAAKLVDLPANLQKAADALQEHNPQLLGIADVVGTAVGLGADGTPVVLVLTKVPGVQGIPASLDGVPVVVEVTGEIKALAPPEVKGKPIALKPTSTWPRPVPIGVSTGNVGECSAGTIGCRVKDTSGNVYALSNNHVYALENKAPLESIVLQPGRYDTGCVIKPDNEIGKLSAFIQIDFSGIDNTVDAAIALSSTTNLGNATPTGGYGIPKSTTATATIGQNVQKYGRTSALTKGRITGIIATINVGYTSGTARFVNQIIVQSSKPFIKAGDSGSLLVTDPGYNPVGLLFAGNNIGTYAIANQIGDVLSAFSALGVTIDGQ
ncbi:MAG: hypothetical protein Q8O92_12090 [Candidatus Latescibacter sp.]|nr:hypothetical protein [Candidatus Latescibacter sp.]